MNTVSSERSNLILQIFVLIHGHKNQAFDQTKSNHSKTGKEITRTATEGLLSNLLLNERKHRNQEGHARLGAQEKAQLGASTHGADALSAGLRLPPPGLAGGLDTSSAASAVTRPNGS